MEKLSRIEASYDDIASLKKSRIEEILKEKIGLEYVKVPRISRIEKLLDETSFGTFSFGILNLSPFYIFGSAGTMEVKT